jgi:hypothetical protein
MQSDTERIPLTSIVSTEVEYLREHGRLEEAYKLEQWAIDQDAEYEHQCH